MKAKDVRGFMIEFDKDNSDVLICINSIIRLQGNREITLNQENLAKVLFKHEWPDGYWLRVDQIQRDIYLRMADTIIAAESYIIESPTKDKK